MSKSRLFYGSYTNATFYNFIFADGFHTNEGGSMMMENDSIVTVVDSSFVKSKAPFGSAIQVNNSKLIVDGLATSFVNNTGTGPPLALFFSHLNISRAVFAGNQILNYEAEILLYNSSIDIFNVQYVQSKSAIQQDCNVYVAVDGNDFTRKSSCMTFKKSNQSFPVIDLSEQCPKPPPPIAVPTTSPTCFSGENMVELKDVGLIPMKQLRIGDWVMASSGIYTQVYGFGHYDPNRDGTYLRLAFHENRDVNDTFSNRPPPYIEISSQHIVIMFQLVMLW
jgi:Hint module